ncbi:MAG: hypothetical protein U5L96_17125 [Owenweeksia sp.]|nr:hypothetical protein [Owenweeksia sp.]
MEEIAEEVRKEFQVFELIEDYRTRGHLFTETNPGTGPQKSSPTLAIENYGLTEADLSRKFQAAKDVGFSDFTNPGGNNPGIKTHLLQEYRRGVHVHPRP